MAISKEWAKKVIEEAKKVSDDRDFLIACASALKTDEECEFFIRNAKDFKPDSEAKVMYMVFMIRDRRNKFKGDPNYLKGFVIQK